MERIIKWFISNTVAANMLMFIILVAGTLTLPRLKMEVFPDIDIDAVTITVPYPGSSPSDVEEGICFLIEENLQVFLEPHLLQQAKDQCLLSYF